MNHHVTICNATSLVKRLLVLCVFSLFLFTSSSIWATDSGSGSGGDPDNADDAEDSIQTELEGKLDGLGGDFSSLGDVTRFLCLMPYLHEKHECPDVDCDLNTKKLGITIRGVKPDLNSLTDTIGVGMFKKRIKEYFEYQAPANNRDVYLDKDYHDYDINMTAERTRAPSSRMDNPGLINSLSLDNSKVNEVARQDNRWRDMCLIGENHVDIAGRHRSIHGSEEPLSGIGGTTAIYDKSSNTLNCIPNKNTERVSPLTFDKGWRYRDMCPGSQQLRRVERNKNEIAMDLFRGHYACLTPLPKCDLKDDWKLGEIDWINKEYHNYATRFGLQILNEVGAIVGVKESSLLIKLKDILPVSQYEDIIRILTPRLSSAAECKPAFWVRLMLDSCANQYILNKGMNPDYIYNSDKSRIGDSGRFCQPFDAKPLSVFEKEEYNPATYITRSYKALLDHDLTSTNGEYNYMPWVEYDRHEGSFADDSKQYRANNWPERQIIWGPGGKSANWSNWVATKTAAIENDFLTASGLIAQLNPLDKKINKYASQKVERIVDPLHPYSPRYDIATDIEGKYLLDREIFGDATESPKPIPTWALIPLNVEGLKKYACVPRKKNVGKGYFEYGCTIYCSAVNVDLLRFRYKDYRLCMGCQIETNQKAFWEEYDINRKHYRKEYCWAFSNKDECEYGDEICGECPWAIVWWAAYGASCIVGCVDKFKDWAIESTEGCIKCYEGAKAESLERTRKGTNGDDGKEEPEWGPSAVGNNWPVCSTQFDHNGDKDLCEKAKKEYTCDNQGEEVEDDPNIAEESKDAAEQCIEKDIDKICGDAAKPVYSVNFLKIRTRKGDFKTDDVKPTLLGDDILSTLSDPVLPVGTNDFDERVEEYRSRYADEDPAKGYGFREYFGNHRPYMRWWDTGEEAFQPTPVKPDYWCDWGANDTIIGVGRDYNSIHGRKAQLCRYGGGDGIGNDCFKMQDWKDGVGVPHDRKFPSLAGSEWAELKMYQANCFRSRGLNCLCQYEKTFKNHGSEDKALAMMGAELNLKYKGLKETSRNADRMASSEIEWPMSWRGYVSTPANRDAADTARTAPAMGKNQQFPYLFGDPKAGSMITGLDNARKGDIVIWPAGLGTLPHVAVVTATNNLSDYNNIMSNVPNGSRWVRVSEANNGKYPDACGNTSYLGHGPERTLYATEGELPDNIQRLIKEQVTSTYYCYDPELGDCVIPDYDGDGTGDWDTLQIYRPYEDEIREAL